MAGIIDGDGFVKITMCISAVFILPVLFVMLLTYIIPETPHLLEW